MDKIEKDGVTYYSQESMEKIISGRIAKYATKLSSSEERVSELQSKLDETSSENSNVSLLREKLETMQKELTRSQSKYQRHRACSAHGIANPEIIELFEIYYEKDMSKAKKKDQVPLEQWLESAISDPESAHIAIRSFLPKKEQEQPEEQPEEQPLEQAARTIPNINSGVIHNQPAQIIRGKRIGSLTTEEYRANREEYIKAYYQQNQKRS